MTEKQKSEAKFLDTPLSDEDMSMLQKQNLLILAVTLLHDGGHIRQAIRWKYKIPLQLWVINLAVYVLPAVTQFLIKSRRAER